MTPDERDEIRRSFTYFISQDVPGQVAATFCYGFLVPIAGVISLHFARRVEGPRAKNFVVVQSTDPIFDRRKGQMIARFQLATTSLGILLFTGWLAVAVTQNVLFLQFLTMESPSLAVRKAKANSLILKLDIVWNWFSNIPPIMNDAFIIWRAWVLFGSQRWALYVSVGLATITTVLTLVVLSMYSNMDYLIQTFETRSQVYNWLTSSLTIASLFTNVVSTSFVAYRLWVHIRVLKRSCESRDQTEFRLKRILFLLVDAGLVYAVLQICVLTLNLTTGTSASTANVASYIFVLIYNSVSFVYPALTIALIRGPFSIAGLDRTVVEFSDSTA